jgi:hypothetical protein
MLEAIISTLSIMGWLGIVLGILVIVNTLCGTMRNIYEGQDFTWKRLFTGLLKSVAFYIGAAMVGVAFTMLPYINEMIIAGFNVTLLSTELLNALSSVGVLGTVISTITVQGKKAIQGIIELAQVSADTEQITWEVWEDEEDL